MTTILDAEALRDLAHIRDVEVVLGGPAFEVDPSRFELDELGVDRRELGDDDVEAEAMDEPRIAERCLTLPHVGDRLAQVGELGPRRLTTPDLVVFLEVIEDSVEHEVVETTGHDRRAGRTLPGRRLPATPIDDRLTERRLYHRIAARLTPDEVAKQRRRGGRRLPRLGPPAKSLHRVEEDVVDDRRMGARLHVVAASRLAEIDAVLENPLDGRLRPVTSLARRREGRVELVRDRPGADADRATLERRPHSRVARRVEHERKRATLGVPGLRVSDRRPAREVDAALDRRPLRGLASPLELLPLLASERGAHGEIELVVAVRRVDPVGHRHEANSGPFEALPHLARLRAVLARQAIGRLDDDPGRLAALARRDRAAEAALLPRLRARDAGLPHFLGELDVVVQGSPGLDGALLALARLDRVFLRRLSIVGNQQGRLHDSILSLAHRARLTLSQVRGRHVTYEGERPAE